MSNTDPAIPDLSTMTAASLRALRDADPAKFLALDAFVRERGTLYVRQVMEVINIPGLRELSLTDARMNVVTALTSAVNGADPERSEAGPKDAGIQALAAQATGLMIRLLWATIGHLSEDMLRLGNELPRLHANGRLAQAVTLDIGDAPSLATSKPGEVPAIIRSAMREVVQATATPVTIQT